jgi:hypothetical protein
MSSGAAQGGDIAAVRAYTQRVPASTALRALARSAPATARSLILAALDAAGGNRTRAALALRADGLLVGTDRRAPITLHEVIRDLPGLREEIDARFEAETEAAMEARGRAVADRAAKTRAKPVTYDNRKKK